MTIQEFIEKTTTDDQYLVRPYIECMDGFSMSVQGSYSHYCSPRYTTNHYDKMEIGFPSDEEPLILSYADDKDNPTDTVYGYVPVSIIAQVIEKHGGIDVEKTFGQVLS